LEDEIAPLKQENLQSHKEIERLTNLIEDLLRQLQQALDGNDELRKLMKELQAKLEILIVQTKKGNKKKHAKTTEKHNPRPAPASVAQPQPPIADKKAATPSRGKSSGKKHILDNARHLPHEQVPHFVSPEEAICPKCSIETDRIDSQVIHQLENDKRKLENY